MNQPSNVFCGMYIRAISPDISIWKVHFYNHCYVSLGSVGKPLWCWWRYDPSEIDQCCFCWCPVAFIVFNSSFAFSRENFHHWYLHSVEKSWKITMNFVFHAIKSIFEIRKDGMSIGLIGCRSYLIMNHVNFFSSNSHMDWLIVV